MPEPDDPRIALGQVVRQLRTAQGISQEELGNRSGLHRNWIGSLERGEISPTWTSTKRLAGGLGITHAALATMEEALAGGGRKVGSRSH